jgi:putative Mg2+ transporter-C (MgtC) family protein
MDVIIATLLCGILGLERDFSNKSLGVRSCVLLSSSLTIILQLSIPLIKSGYFIDGGRILSYCIAGVGFIGSGCINKDSCNTTGLTTACLLLSIVGISACCAYKFFDKAVLLWLISLIALSFNYLKQRFFK